MYNLKLTSEQVDKLGDVLNARGWPTREVQYARHAFDGDNVKVVAYESGKLVVQGKGTEDFVTNILEPEVTGEFKLGMKRSTTQNGLSRTRDSTRAGKVICLALWYLPV